MFERFSDRARRVVVLAQEEARALDHDYIGTEHLLLGLIHEGDGVAATALSNLGVSLEAVRYEVQEATGRGQQVPGGNIPFTPRAKKVLELSFREARKLGYDHIDTEHILLGLIREGEGVAAQVLAKLGADPKRVRHEVTELESAAGGPAGAAEAGMPEMPAETGAPETPAEAAARAGADDLPLDEIRALLGEVIERLDRIERRLRGVDPATGEGR